MAGSSAVTGERRRSDAPARPPWPTARRRLPSPRLLLVVAVLTTVVGGAAIWLLYGSEWLRVERVTTSGTRVLTPEEVLDAASVPVGAPLISVDAEAIEDRLRRELPRIDSVDAVRSWPHGIALKVTERKPVLLLEKDGKFVEVDAEGVRFATVTSPPKNVPKLQLTADRSPSLHRFGIDRLLVEAVEVARDIPPVVASRTRTMEVRSYDSISLELTDGRTVDWGSGEKGESKAAALTALMKAAPDAEHFDVSAPTSPAVSGS
ncbi:cell division protein FtsQ/DivIB [Streptomyces indicus]|uniref:Cell division protein FtsQ n=1 Tax=Streptomyces indicus TaxID=417292 RepID=A0A1G8YXZ7_9ACTN|nr:FtsQ-type POTRA domain-containing protein [Streptomyces indicus]SDK07661.1 cell division protein FtsQ [Streptomyces indicus]